MRSQLFLKNSINEKNKESLKSIKTFNQGDFFGV